jgi:hypothetical protein
MHWKPTILVSNGTWMQWNGVFCPHIIRLAWWFRVSFYWVVVIIIAIHTISHDDHNSLMESHWYEALLQKVLSIPYKLWSQQPNGKPLTWGLVVVATGAFPLAYKLWSQQPNGQALIWDLVATGAFDWHMSCDPNNLMENHWCGPWCQLQQVLFPLCNCCNGLKIVP